MKGIAILAIGIFLIPLVFASSIPIVILNNIFNESYGEITNFTTQQICLSGDCKIEWPSGGGSSYNETYDSLNSTYGKWWYNMTPSGYAEYNFSANNFNGTGNFSTTGLINSKCSVPNALLCIGNATGGYEMNISGFMTVNATRKQVLIGANPASTNAGRLLYVGGLGEFGTLRVNNGGYWDNSVFELSSATSVRFSNYYNGRMRFTFTSSVTDAMGLDANGNLTVVSNVSALTFKANPPANVQPYMTTSTTLNTNLNADLLDGYNSTNFTLANTCLLLTQPEPDGQSVGGNTIPTFVNGLYTNDSVCVGNGLASCDTSNGGYDAILGVGSIGDSNTILLLISETNDTQQGGIIEVKGTQENPDHRIGQLNIRYKDESGGAGEMLLEINDGSSGLVSAWTVNSDGTTFNANVDAQSYSVGGTGGTDDDYDDGTDTYIDFQKGIATTVSTNYDSILMQNITSLENLSSRVLNLTPISWQWNAFGKLQFSTASKQQSTVYGFDGKEVLKYYPQCAITRVEEDKYKDVPNAPIEINIKDAFKTVIYNETMLKQIPYYTINSDKMGVTLSYKNVTSITDRQKTMRILKDDVSFDEKTGKFYLTTQTQVLIKKGGTYTTYNRDCLNTMLWQTVQKICTRSPALCQ